MSIHDRAIHSQGREVCLALATICECCSQWDGARTLRHAAEHLYREKYRSMMEPIHVPDRRERLSRQIDGMDMVLHTLVNGAGNLRPAPIFSEEEK